MRLFCKSSSMMDKQMLADVYLNAPGINPFTHVAMDAINNLAETIMECIKWVANDRNPLALKWLNLGLESAFASWLV